MIERLALQRRQLPARSGAAPRRASRWQRWASVLMARWGLRPGAPALSTSYRRSRPVALGPTIVQRIEASLLFRQSFQFDQRRSVLHRHDARHSHVRTSHVVQALLRSVPVERWMSLAVPRLRALPPLSLLERSVERRERLHREREVFRLRLLERSSVHSLSSPPIRAEAAALRRRAAPADDAPTRLARRVQRVIVDAANLAPLRLVVARPTPAAAARAVPELPSPPGLRRALPSDAAAAPAWTPQPALNLDRLAEQVIDRIDRRVVAQRERMGRI